MSRSRNRRRREQWKAQQPKQPQRRESKTTIKPKDLMPKHIGTSNTAVKTSYTGYTYGKYTRWCDHWQQPFTLNDGLNIFVSAYSDRPNYNNTTQDSIIPDVGFYLDNYWQRGQVLVSAGSSIPLPGESRTQTVLWPWPDRGAPGGSMRQFEAAVQWVLRQIAEGKIVETGCFAAHGRTGTFLACLLVAQGVEATAAILRVRDEHCKQSVESAEQVQFVRRFDSLVNGRVHLPGFDDAVPSDWTRGGSSAGRTTSATTPPANQTTIFSEREPLSLTQPGPTGTLQDEKFCNVCPHTNHWGRECDTCGCRFSSKAAPKVSRSQEDDDADYELWLRLNANGNDVAMEELQRQTNITYDAGDCAFPPCMDRAVCEIDEGGCYKAAMWTNDGDRDGWWC